MTRIFTTAALVLSATTATPRPEIWIMPPAAPDGRCLRELFTRPDEWKETRSRVNVLGYAGQMLDKQFTDDELRAWLPQVEKWGLKLGLEVGAPSRAVPETGEWTFTRSVRDFVRKFVR